MLIDISFMKEAFIQVIQYLPVTIAIAVTAIAVGICLGIAIAMIQIKKIRILYEFTLLYNSFMRGTPVIVQLYLVYFGLPELMRATASVTGISALAMEPSAVFCAFLAFALNSAAFLSIIFRSTISAVDHAQLESALSVGMTNGQAYRLIILPQAFRKAVPLLGNNFLGIIKGTSLAFSISVMEITAKAIAVGSIGLRFTESYIVVALIYFAVCKIVEKLFQLTERKLSVY